MRKNTILSFKNPDPGSDIIFEWDADRAAFVRKDCTIIVNWPKLGSVVLQPIKSAIVYLFCRRYEVFLLAGCSTVIYTLCKQNLDFRFVQVFLALTFFRKYITIPLARIRSYSMFVYPN